MFHPIKFSVLIAAFAFAGACAPPVTNNNDVQTQDAAQTQDTPPADTGPTCTGTAPPEGSPWCAMPGCPFRPLTLPLCDGSGDYAFYGEDFCQATATVMVISAGWCVPCQMEAPMIQSLVTEGYADRGVRVITVYAQNPNGSTPDDTNCNNWRTRFHLTSHMTRDPNGLTQPYTPMNAFPSNLVIDQNGNVVDVLYGSETGLSMMTGDLDAILQAQGR